MLGVAACLATSAPTDDESELRAALVAVGDVDTEEAAKLHTRLATTIARDRTRWAEALVASERALRIRRALHPVGHVERIHAELQVLTYRPSEGGQAWLDEVLGSVESTASGVEPEERLHILERAGSLLWDRGELQAGLEQLQRALSLVDEIPDVDSVRAARLRGQVGHALCFLEACDEGWPLLEQAHTALASSPGYDLARADVLDRMAQARRSVGDLEDAVRRFGSALELRERWLDPEHRDVGRSLLNLGNLHDLLGDYPKAQDLLERALTIQIATVGDGHRDVADTFYALGRLAARMGDASAARSRLERSTHIAELALGPDHIDVARALDGRAIVHAMAGDHAAARGLWARALSIQETALGPDHPLVAATVLNLAGSAFTSGDLPTAIRLTRRSVAIEERLGRAATPDGAVTRHNLARLHLHAGELEDARASARRALDLRRRLLGTGHPAVAETLGLLARIAWAAGDGETTLERGLEAESIAREHFVQTSSRISQSEALVLGASRRREGLDTALSVVAESSQPPKDVARVWDGLVRSRSLVFDEMLTRNRLARSAPNDDTSPLSSALEQSRAHLAAHLARGPSHDRPEEFAATTVTLRDEFRRAEAALARASAPYREAVARREVGLSAALEALPPRAALVAFATYGHSSSGRADAEPVRSYVAFVRPPDRADPIAVGLGPAVRIDAAVESWRSPRSNASIPDAAESRRAGAELRQAVWDPIAPWLEPADVVLVVPDGTLGLVNFAALPIGDVGYLLERDPPVHYVTAEKQLARTTPTATGKGLLAMGGPEFDATPTAGLRRAPSDMPIYRGALPECRTFSSLQFQTLSSARREAMDVASLWTEVARHEDEPEAVLLTDASASEAAFKNLAPGRRFVHLATHAFIVEDRCLVEPELVGPERTSERSTLLTGLAFAGANLRARRGDDGTNDDGILTSEEIAGVDLAGVEWVVLSGCETGAGRPWSSEGIVGLRRAFELAGARTTLVSLWPVEDASARAWMREVYVRRLAGETTADAVAGASRTRLDQLRATGGRLHPSLWGAFVATGDWR